MPPPHPFSPRTAPLARADHAASRGPTPSGSPRSTQRKPNADAPPPSDHVAPQEGARITAALAHCDGWQSCFIEVAAPPGKTRRP